MYAVMASVSRLPSLASAPCVTFLASAPLPTFTSAYDSFCEQLFNLPHAPFYLPHLPLQSRTLFFSE